MSGRPHSATGLEARKMADRRHMPVKGMLDDYWRAENPMIPSLPWDGADAGALANFLRANPDITPDIVFECLKHRLASEDHAPGERVHRWIGDLLRYAQGPLNRFKQPMRPASSEASVGTYKPGKKFAEPESTETIRQKMGEPWFDKTWKRYADNAQLTDLERDCLKQEGFL